MSDQLIEAREISEYVYCRRAWWLSRVRGYDTANVRQLEAGTAYHKAHGRLVGRAVLARRIAYALVFVAFALFVFVLIHSYF
ncbi:MAG: hypothetical protein R3272_11845 [Candidatus Promineifilaceae bacterium]|nr:hypothetical protein [Candidatus Promineifilaceae bacterium]